ncbi:hypothetical protein B1S15_25070 [Salmonella enterica]|nr:hypothetical protein [Salmonella enterica]
MVKIAINARRVMLATSMELAVNINVTRKLTTWIVSETLKNSTVVIYHNIRCVHRLRGPQGVSDGKPVKQATIPPVNRPNRDR